MPEALANLNLSPQKYCNTIFLAITLLKRINSSEMLKLKLQSMFFFPTIIANTDHRQQKLCHMVILSSSCCTKIILWIFLYDLQIIPLSDVDNYQKSIILH